MSPDTPTDETWQDLVKPIADRLALAETLDMEFVHEPRGAGALAALLREMARRMDAARIAAQEEP